MEFLSEIDSPIPGPLRVAADVSLTRRLLGITGKAIRGEVDVTAAESDLAATVELARRLGAHLHLDAVRHDVSELVRARMAALVDGQGAAIRSDELCDILGLAQRLGLGLDLWDSQNRLWEWAATPEATFDWETLCRLARSLWFDETTVEARAGHAPREQQGSRP